MVNIERLQQLRRVVEAAPADRFHMRTYCERAACGTAYCAAGWAAIDPWFKKNTKIRNIFSVKRGWVESVGSMWITKLQLASLFDIRDEDAQALFAFLTPALLWADPHAVTREQVIANIDRLIAGQPAEPYVIAEANAS